MKKPIIITFLSLLAIMFYSCDDYDTYAEQKAKEKAHINDFIADNEIKVIDMETFEKNDFATDTAKNEFVLFKDKGVYMQIVRRGTGEPMADGERIGVLARYLEYNIADGDTISGNLYASSPDKFTCTRSGDTFSAFFTQGYMLGIYGSSAVPGAWMLPLSYISLSRVPYPDGFQGAYVRLIVPHSQGTSTAAQYVYPTYYEIKYLREP